MRALPLGGGAHLAWREWGATDGLPVLYCHGFPGSRLEAALADTPARELGIRLIAPDRPGLGHSAPLPGGLATRSEALERLTRHLGLRRWGLLGVSAGGAYALALAAHHPPGLTALACVAPLVPTAPLDGMHPLARRLLHWARHHPRRLRRITAVIATVLYHHPHWGPALLRPFLAPPDRAVFQDPAQRRLWTNSLREGLRQGGTAAEDLIELIREWRLPTSLPCPLELWHGNQDTQVPPNHSRWLATHLPQARLHLETGEGHFSLPLRQARRILGQLKERLQAPDGAPHDHRPL